MHWIKIFNTANPNFPNLRAKNCKDFFCQLRGLSFRRSMPEDEGILLVQSRESKLDAAIHMFFMWMDITVVWLNKEKQVVDKRIAKRWHPIYVPQAPAMYVLELAPIWQDHFSIGDQIEFDAHTSD